MYAEGHATIVPLSGGVRIREEFADTKHIKWLTIAAPLTQQPPDPP